MKDMIYIHLGINCLKLPNARNDSFGTLCRPKKFKRFCESFQQIFDYLSFNNDDALLVRAPFHID